jgi:hypothetical protein
VRLAGEDEFFSHKGKMANKAREVPETGRIASSGDACLPKNERTDQGARMRQAES